MLLFDDYENGNDVARTKMTNVFKCRCFFFVAISVVAAASAAAAAGTATAVSSSIFFLFWFVCSIAGCSCGIFIRLTPRTYKKKLKRKECASH